MDDNELLDALIEYFAFVECYPDEKRGVNWTVGLYPHRKATEECARGEDSDLREAIRKAVRGLREIGEE